jgi:hypothetical protein
VLGILCPDGRVLVLYYGKSIGLRTRYSVRRSGGGKTGGKNASRVDKQHAGHRGAAVLRAKPAAERAAMFQKGWAKRRANAAVSRPGTARNRLGYFARVRLVKPGQFLVVTARLLAVRLR